MAAIPYLSLRFKKEYPQSACYETLFRTIPQQRLNNCYIYSSDNEQASDYSVEIYGLDDEKFKIILDVLCGSSNFMLHLKSEPVILEAGVRPVGSLATINSYRVSFHEGKNSAVKQGYDAAVAKEKYHSSVSFPPQPCPKCGEETENFPHCPKCGEQLKQLRTWVKAYLIVSLIFTVNNVLTSLGAFSRLSLQYAPFVFRLYPFITLAGLVIQIIAVTYLFHLRRLGFYLLVALRVTSTFLPLLFGQSLSSIAIYIVLLIPALFIIYAILDKDLAIMK